MNLVRAEGTHFYYLLGSEDMAKLTSIPLRFAPIDPCIANLVLGGKDTRLVAFQSMLRRQKGHIYFLYWNKSMDLDSLDRRVTQGTYTDEDFASAVRTVHQNTWCQCGKIWSTLVIPSGDPYIEAPGLDDRKFSNSKFLLCPSCRGSLRQAVVRIYQNEPLLAGQPKMQQRHDSDP